MKKIIFLLLILSYVALPQAGKSVLTQKQRDSIAVIIKDSTLIFIPNPSTYSNSMFWGNGGRNLLHSTGTEGYQNTLAGFNAGVSLTTGYYNTAFGWNSMQAITEGTFNTAYGWGSQRALTTGTYNVSMGENALFSVTTQGSNTAIGSSAMGFALGDRNTAIGTGALHQPMGAYASDNTMVGWYSGNRLLTGSDKNTMIGTFTGYQDVSMSYAVFLGYCAGQQETESSRLIIDNTPRETLIKTRLHAPIYGILGGVPSLQKLYLGGQGKVAINSMNADSTLGDLDSTFTVSGGTKITGGLKIDGNMKINGTVVSFRGVPTSSGGLEPGNVYSNNGFLLRKPDYDSDVMDYIDRVEADGGIVLNGSGLDSLITLLKDSSIYSDLRILADPNWGIKKDANGKVTKLYDFFGNDLIGQYGYGTTISDTSLVPSFSSYSNNDGDGTYLSTIVFDGVNDALKDTLMSLEQPTTMFFNVRPLSYVANRNYFSGYSAYGSTPEIWVSQNNADGYLRIDGSTYFQGTNIMAVTDSMATLRFVLNGASSEMQYNAEAEETGDIGTGNLNGLSVGGSSFPFFFTKIELGTVIVFDTLLTDNQTTAVRDYLTYRWDYPTSSYAGDEPIISLPDTATITAGYVPKKQSDGTILWQPDISTSGAGLFNPDGITIDTTALGIARITLAYQDSIHAKMNRAEMTSYSKTGHTHAISAVTNLQDSLTAKANTAWFAISPTLIDDSIAVKMNRAEMTGYSPTSHTHIEFSDTVRVGGWSIGMGNTDLDTLIAGSFGGIKLPNDYTVTEVAAYTNTGTVTFNIEERGETTPNTSGTDVMTSDLVADTDQQETGTFSNATLDRNDWLILTIVSISGEPTIFSVTVRGVKTD